MIVLALDPGNTTGYATGVIEDERLISIQSGQRNLSPYALWGMLESIRPAYLVAESFDYRNKPRPGLVLYSRNLLGVCSLWAELRNSSFSEQSAAEGKGFYSDQKLRELGVYSVGKDHARDATRHLLYFLTMKKGSQLWHEAPNYPSIQGFGKA